MATDATGTPTTAWNIPKFSTPIDAPSGAGSNAQMDAIDVALTAVRGSAIVFAIVLGS
jgi:hypothetical protein